MWTFAFKDSGFLLSDDIAFGWVNPAGLVFPIHNHDYYEVFIMFHGRLKHLLQEGSCILKRGDIVFVRPWDIHGFEMVDGEDFLFLNIPFTEKVLRNLGHFTEETNSLKELCDAPAPVHGRIDLMSLPRYEALKSGMNNLSHMRRSVYLALATAISEGFLAGREDSADQGPAWFQRLCLEMTLTDNWRDGLTRLYELCDKSPEHISRTFQKYLHMTPTAYINRLRIHHACIRLTHTSMSILDISYAIGFDSVSYFYRVFHEITGMAPMEYRNGQRIEGREPE